MTTEQKIRNFIESDLLWERAPDDLNDDSSLIERGLIDSLGIVKIVSFLESEFGIKVGDDEVLPRHFESIRALTAFVEEKSASE